MHSEFVGLKQRVVLVKIRTHFLHHFVRIGLATHVSMLLIPVETYHGVKVLLVFAAVAGNHLRERRHEGSIKIAVSSVLYGYAFDARRLCSENKRTKRSNKGSQYC